MDYFLVALLGLGVLGLLVGIILLTVAFATKQKLKMPLIVLVASLAVTIISIGGMVVYENHVEAVAAQVRAERIAAAKKRDKRMEKKFDTEYSALYVSQFSAAAHSEDLANKVQKVWGNTIYNDSVIIDGKTYTDFSKAVDAEVAYETKDTSEISDAESDMDSSLDVLAENVTSKTQSRYAEAKKTVAEVEKLDSMATDPSGSYNNYGNRFSTQDDKVASLLQ